MYKTAKTRPLRRTRAVYTSSGEWAALLIFPNLYNLMGEWIGWITDKREVYDVNGFYVGWLDQGPRILRRRALELGRSRLAPPPHPGNIRPPANVPLPPMMAELPFQITDVLECEPHRLHTIDTAGRREDLQ